MGITCTANTREIVEAVEQLTENGKWLALENAKLLMKHGYGKRPPRPDAKIIPFLATRPVAVGIEAAPRPIDFQTQLDDFLREMGYIG